MRGKRNRILPFSRTYRITPAGAGKTNSAADCGHPDWDHPRRCGENSGILNHATSCRGSPPQVRGKHPCFFIKAFAYRITPAGAGKTCAAGIVAHADGDHPRRCGENPFVRNVKQQSEGSPPQVRGKLSYAVPVARMTRITPAGAGKTFLFLLRITIIWDHPRRCGENGTDAGY